jgi:hypothetical protein
MPDPFEIKFDESGLKDLVAGWVMQQMGGEQQQAVLSAAIKHLITAPKDNYGRASNSPIQLSFNRAVEIAMDQVARDIVMNDPHIQAQVREMVIDAFSKYMSSWAGEKAKRAVVEALVDSMQKTEDM